MNRDKLLSAYHDAALSLSHYNAAQGDSWTAERGDRALAKQRFREALRALQEHNIPVPKGDYLL